MQTPDETPLPSRTAVPELFPVVIHKSSADVFNLTTDGFITDGNNETDIDKRSLNKVSFDKQHITIAEQSSLNSEIPLYFMASKPDSKITIHEGVKSSNIGITSDNSPTVEISHNVAPLSLLHNSTDGGKITLSVLDDSVDGVILRELNNRKGDFSLLLSNSVKSVTFQSLIMSFVSSFTAAHQSSNLKLLADDNVDVHVDDQFTVSPQSDASISSLVLDGTLNINDDSTLKIKRATFSEKSDIHLVLGQDQSQQPVIQVSDSLTTNPSKVTLSSEYPIAVENLPVIAAKSIDNSTNWENIFHFDDGVDGQIQVKREESNGQTVVYLSAKQDTKKKSSGLSGGAIAGIVIACVVVLVAIIAISVYCSKHNRKNDRSEMPNNTLGEHLNVDI